MAKRLETARTEIAAAQSEPLFDATVVNNDLDTAYAELRAFILRQAPQLAAQRK